MKKFNSLQLLFMGYLVLVLGFFAYTSLTGTRMLGDDKEEYQPQGRETGSTGRIRTQRFYHK